MRAYAALFPSLLILILLGCGDSQTSRFTEDPPAASTDIAPSSTLQSSTPAEEPPVTTTIVPPTPGTLILRRQRKHLIASLIHLYLHRSQPLLKFSNWGMFFRPASYPWPSQDGGDWKLSPTIVSRSDPSQTREKSSL